MQQGWIKLHRQIQENAIWSGNEPFDCRSAWIDLILLANHEPKEILLNGTLTTIQRGQLHRSQMFLAERWHWSRKRIKKYLSMLKNAEMIDFLASTNGTTRGTTITIVNYDKYQFEGTTEVSTKCATEVSTGVSTGEQQRSHKQEIKNDKNVKNEKKDIYTSVITEILNYLNLKTGKKYTGRSKAQREHIIARLKEGYTVDEFKTVIDNKVKAWGHDDKMRQYLRPETLFSTKFETYLNDTETELQRARREDHESDEKQREAIRRAGTVEIGYRE